MEAGSRASQQQTNPTDTEFCPRIDTEKAIKEQYDSEDDCTEVLLLPNFHEALLADEEKSQTVYQRRTPMTIKSCSYND